MAVFAVYLQKEINYMGAMRPFGNTYHFQTATLQGFNDLEVAEQVLAAEQQCTSDLVHFTGWSTWGPTDGSTTNNVMREAGAFDANGDLSGSPFMYAENCALVVWPLPRSPEHNVRRWLRKFIRMPTGPTLPDAGVLRGAEPMAADMVGVLEDYAAAIGSVNSQGAVAEYCLADGTLPTGPAVVRPYLITRDIGR